MTPAKKSSDAKSSKPKAAKKSAAPTPRKEEAPERKSPARPDEMSGEVMEFITAIDEYKRVHQRPFPSWSEVLEILKELGYSRSA